METSVKNKKSELLEKQKKYLFPNHILYYTEPLPLDYGEGVFLWDVEGKKYLDFFGGILTTSVGHNRPEVTQAVQTQTEKMIHSSTLYPNQAHINLAEKMAAITPGKLQVLFDFHQALVQLHETFTGLEVRVVFRDCEQAAYRARQTRFLAGTCVYIHVLLAAQARDAFEHTGFMFHVNLDR